MAGGGARGYAHAGVLHALERMGCSPAGIVGVSMGAVVAATYAARTDWYEALLSIELAGAPTPGNAHGSRGAGRGRRGTAWSKARTAWNMLRGWGAPDTAEATTRAALSELLGDSRLDAGRTPVTVCATDLLSGTRVEFSEGPAVPAVYASSALAGVLPPARDGVHILADGVYADIAPVDIARRSGALVVAVDPRQDATSGGISNGLQAVMRAMEVCHSSHAQARLDMADLVLQPTFSSFVDVLDFEARRDCAASGIRAVRGRRDELRDLLSSV